jgi:Prokaryotic membrane lipoprotein lipid attachment site
MRRSFLPLLAVVAVAGCGGTYGSDDDATPRQSSAGRAGDDVVLHSIRPRGHRHHVAAPVELAER